MMSCWTQAFPILYFPFLAILLTSYLMVARRLPPHPVSCSRTGRGSGGGGSSAFFSYSLLFLSGRESFSRGSPTGVHLFGQTGHMTSSTVIPVERQQSCSDWYRPAGPQGTVHKSCSLWDCLESEGPWRRNNFHNNTKKLLAWYHCVDMCTDGAKADLRIPLSSIKARPEEVFIKSKRLDATLLDNFILKNIPIS